MPQRVVREGWTLLTRQMAFELLPASALLGFIELVIDHEQEEFA